MRQKASSLELELPEFPYGWVWRRSMTNKSLAAGAKTSCWPVASCVGEERPQLFCWHNIDGKCEEMMKQILAATVATLTGFTMILQTTLWPVRDTTRRLQHSGARHTGHGVPLRSVVDRLRIWRERMGARRRLRNLYALDDHILQDIGMIRTALRWEAEKPFRR